MRPYIILPLLALLNLGANAATIHNFNNKNSGRLSAQDSHNRRQVRNADFSSSAVGPAGNDALSNPGSSSVSGFSSSSGPGSAPSLFDPVPAAAAAGSRPLDRRVISVDIDPEPGTSLANGEVKARAKTGSTDTLDHEVEERSPSSIEDDEHSLRRRLTPASVQIEGTPQIVSTEAQTGQTDASLIQHSVPVQPLDDSVVLREIDPDASSGDDDTFGVALDDPADSSANDVVGDDDPIARDDTADPVVRRSIKPALLLPASNSHLNEDDFMARLIDTLLLSGSDNPSRLTINAAQLQAMMAHLDDVCVWSLASSFMAPAGKRMLNEEAPADVPMSDTPSSRETRKSLARSLLGSFVTTGGTATLSCDSPTYQFLWETLSAMRATIQEDGIPVSPRITSARNRVRTRRQNLGNLPVGIPPLPSIPPRGISVNGVNQVGSSMLSASGHNVFVEKGERDER